MPRKSSSRAATAVLLFSACSFENSPPSLLGDVDGDGITDGEEGWDGERNTDGDEYPDWRDHDSDADGIADAIEAGDADPATPPIDTDEDGVPDYLDDDSDDDSIADADEGTGDQDADGEADFRDDDTDSDGIPDVIEAGDEFLDTPPNDSDSDGVPDFRDLDSDGDYIPDAEEDPNGNGVVDPGESSPFDSDTDGDGIPDLAEELLQPGDFFFILPFQGPGAEGNLDFATTLRTADVFFSVDTTGSFQEEIDAIQAAIETTIIPGVTAVIPDAAYGVGRFEDFPLAGYGLSGDKPFELLQAVTTDTAAISAGLAALGPAAGGLDIPESGYEALYQWAAGTGFAAFGIPPFFPGAVGGAGFRTDALPIIVQITDARSHLPGEYVEFSADAHGEAEATAALNRIGARVIGVDSLQNTGTADDPRAQMEALAIATNALVPPVSGSCSTGVAGAPRAPVNVGGQDTCPLVFDVNPDGTGLATQIVVAIEQLASYGTIDISTVVDGELEGVNGEVLPPGVFTDDFITAVTPVPPPPAGASIDGDVFRDVTPGSTVTFRIEAFNAFVPQTFEDQLFRCRILVFGDGVTLLDTRDVYIIVPRTIIIVE